MTVGSLFSGAGGMDLGLEHAGFQIAFQVEVDEYCRRVLAKHWPSVPRYGDIREVTGEQLGYCDVLAGGPPCQPSSVAGRRHGRADERWLWPEFARLVREVGPRFVLLENVPGLLTVDGGSAFGSILADLADLGFDAEWSVLSACAMGAPHTRERVFLLGYANGERLHGRAPEQTETIPSRRYSPGVRNGADKPRVDGTAYGVPHRMDRLRALGNAVYPDCAEVVGRRILAAAGELA